MVARPAPNTRVLTVGKLQADAIQNLLDSIASLIYSKRCKVFEKDEAELDPDEVYAKQLQQSEFDLATEERNSVTSDAGLARRLADPPDLQGEGPHEMPPPEPQGSWRSVGSGNRFAVLASPKPPLALSRGLQVTKPGVSVATPARAARAVVLARDEVNT